MTTHRPAVFLDRDGTLNEMVYDESHGIVDSPLRPEDLVLKRQAAPFVRALNHWGYLCLVVTNQPGLAKGSLTQERLNRIHGKLRSDLRANGAILDGILFCPHHPDPGLAGRAEYAGKCPCRKPAPGMILDAAVRHHVDLSRSFMVGDGLTDVEAGRRAGVATILVARLQPALLEQLESWPQSRPDRFAADLNEARQIIGRRREELRAGGG